MIAIDVELMTGRYVATSFHDRAEPEWPPHPARLFSALVATAAEHDGLVDGARQALRWLERQGAPRVLASDASPRAVLTTYVPVNAGRVLGDWSRQDDRLHDALKALDEAQRGGDAKAIRRAQRSVDTARKQLEEQIARSSEDDGDHSPAACSSALRLLPQHRDKQPRTLPSVTPDEPRVRYVWPDAEPDVSTRDALSELARRLVRLGHSSSLVACRVVDEAPAPGGLDAWVPSGDTDDTAGLPTLRTVEPGQLAHLDSAHARHRGVEPRVLPARHHPYRRGGDAGADATPASVFGEWIVLREIDPDGGRRLGVGATRTEDVTRAMRGALLRHADEPAPSILTGHAPGGGRLEQPHVAFVTLPDVGSPHSHGRILGAAIVLPLGIGADDRRAVLRAVGRWEQAGLELTMGRAGRMKLERVVDRDPRTTLAPSTWTNASRRWASVTPVALDQNPGDLVSRDPRVAAEAAEEAEAIVARACERIGLPAPAWVQVMRRSLFGAAPEARKFMPFPRKEGALQRVCVHVEVLFAKAVSGPVLLGAGRYFGIGLCRPAHWLDARPRGGAGGGRGA